MQVIYLFSQFIPWQGREGHVTDGEGTLKMAVWQIVW